MLYRQTILSTLFALVFSILSANAETLEYTGNIGQYPVSMRLTHTKSEKNLMGGYFEYYSGTYTYTKAGNSLKINATFEPAWYIDDSITYNVTIDEYTSKGKNSGRFELVQPADSENLQGTFTNLSNGKKFNVTLKKK